MKFCRTLGKNTSMAKKLYIVCNQGNITVWINIRSVSAKAN